MTKSGIIVLIILIELILTLFVASKVTYNSFLFFTPKYLYNHSEMNYFGCITCSILLYCIFPIYTIIVTIAWLIWKLFHIGRKEN